MNRFSRPSEKSSLQNSKPREAYDSLGKIPIEIWENIKQTNDFSLFIIKGEYLAEELKAIWFKICNEFIQDFGTSDTYKEYMRLKKKRALLHCDLLLTGNRFKNFEMNIVTAQMINVMKTKNIKFEELVAYLDGKVGFPIDTMKTSAKRFYYYVNQHSKNG